MTTETPTIVGFLLFPGFPMSCLTSAIEPLRVANEIAGARVFDWHLVSEHGGKVTCSARVGFATDLALDGVDRPDLLLLFSGPDGQFATPASGNGRLRHLSRRGTAIGAISGGVFPLARAGLLHGYTASVHWCYRAAFEAEFPGIACSDEVLVIDRNRQTASGAAAAVDLMLHLIGERLGPAVATETACWFQHPMIRGPGVRQRVPTLRSDSTTDTVPDPVRRAIALLSEHIGDTISIAEVADRLHMSQRQLERRFKSTTGQSPSVYYRLLRMKAARQLVRHTARPILDIAQDVDCATSSQLARHYRAVYGMTPVEDQHASTGIRVTADAPPCAPAKAAGQAGQAPSPTGPEWRTAASAPTSEKRRFRLQPARFFQHVPRGAEAFQALRHTAIDRDDVDDGADFLDADPVVQRAPAMQFPFVHLAERADHGEIHHRPRLGVDRVVAPAKAPAPGGHRFLERPGEVVGGGEVLLHILRAHRGLPLLQPFQEQVFIEYAHLLSFPAGTQPGSATASRIHCCRCRIECSEFTPQAGSSTKGPGT